MASNKRARGRREKRRGQADLNPFPGITGEGAEENRSFGDKTKGLFGDGLDGTLGDVSEEQRRQREYGMASGTSIRPISDLWPDGGDVDDG
ncbi:MAG: hypothetical protein IPO81_15605 [Kouleothrix sp.]|nr:hypothetical protein [Kouleothrix sp.]